MEVLLNYKWLAVIVAVAFVGMAALVLWGPSLQQVENSSLPANVIPAQTDQSTSTPAVSEPALFQYIEVLESCGPYFEGACVNMRSGPGTTYPVVLQLRTGMVLKVADTVTRDGREWYKIAPDKTIRYPERLTSGWYVAADKVHLFYDDGDHALSGGADPTGKRIIVDISEQKLYAYDGGALFMEEYISTGLEFTPTPRGTFSVYKMTPSRYMQGPLPGISDQYYDLPGVPWDLYFTRDGAVIHGAYWHDKFGKQWSHGCVNVSPEKAKKLYDWASVGTVVIVRN